MLQHVFNEEKFDATKETCFFGKRINLARYDKQRYPFFDKLTEKQDGFLWRPEEVMLARDSKDFKSLSAHEQHIFTSNLKRQIVLDSVQGRAPSEAFLPICSLPELEAFIITWSKFELLHSRSYTYVIRNIYPNPSEVFDDIMNIEEIMSLATDISYHYDRLILSNARKIIIGDVRDVRPYSERLKHKRLLWDCLNAVNALEGVRFYVSFACSWAFAEMKKMEGNAKIIKFIARDENLHLAATQQLLKILPKEDPDFADIRNESLDSTRLIFTSVAEQEKNWAKYLFKDGSMIGLNQEVLCDYVEWVTNKRMNTIGLEGLFDKSHTNPLLWTEKWIRGEDVQPAPQEVSISAYLIGGVKNDIEENAFKGISL